MLFFYVICVFCCLVIFVRLSVPDEHPYAVLWSKVDFTFTQDNGNVVTSDQIAFVSQSWVLVCWRRQFDRSVTAPVVTVILSFNKTLVHVQKWPLKRREAYGKCPLFVGIDIVRKALRIPCYTIAANAGVDADEVVTRVMQDKEEMGYDALHDQYVDMMKSGIIDPTKVHT